MVSVKQEEPVEMIWAPYNDVTWHIPLDPEPTGDITIGLGMSGDLQEEL